METLGRRSGSWTAAVLVIAMTCLFAAPGPALAQGASSIVVFGDSLSDSGNAFTAIKKSATPPDYSLNPLLIPAAPYAIGGHHLTNGATWIEQLARPLGLARSVDPAFRSANPFAMNFSVATARARDDGANPSLSFLVAAFLQKSGGSAPSDALYVIEVGGNDVRDALLAAGAGADPAPILQAAAASIAQNVGTLYAAGVRQFLIWNAPDVGRTPAAGILDAQVPGAAVLATTLTQGFNALLSAVLAPLAALPGIEIVPFDAYGLITSIGGNPGFYGLTNVTEACVTPNTPPFKCGTPDEYLFWDGVHPTVAAHALIAQAVALLLGL